MEYEALLKRAKALLPESSDSGERFVVPKAKGHIQGSKTVISNFVAIANHLRRKPEHLLKYVMREVAVPGDLMRGAVIFKGKLSASKLNEKIQAYVDTFVICKECGRPDTKLTKEGQGVFLRCSACGARHSVYSKI